MVRFDHHSRAAMTNEAFELSTGLLVAEVTKAGRVAIAALDGVIKTEQVAIQRLKVNASVPQGNWGAIEGNVIDQTDPARVAALPALPPFILPDDDGTPSAPAPSAPAPAPPPSIIRTIKGEMDKKNPAEFDKTLTLAKVMSDIIDLDRKIAQHNATTEATAVPEAGTVVPNAGTTQPPETPDGQS
jgi:hypothetical protein